MFTKSCSGALLSSLVIEVEIKYVMMMMLHHAECEITEPCPTCSGVVSSRSMSSGIAEAREDSSSTSARASS